MDELSLRPHIVHDVVAADAEGERIGRQPEVGEDAVVVVIPIGREDQHEGGQVAGGGEVEPAEAGTSFRRFLRIGIFAGVPFVGCVNFFL